MGDKKLDSQIAEEFARRTFEKLSEEDREFNKTHAKAVVEAAFILAGDKKIDSEIIEIAGWLHDIGKTISEGLHAENTIKILEAEGFEVSDKLRDCILNHGNGGNPQCEEARLIHVADKASIIDRDMLQVIKKYTLNKNPEEKAKDLEFIRKLANGAADLLSQA